MYTYVVCYIYISIYLRIPIRRAYVINGHVFIFVIERSNTYIHVSKMYSPFRYDIDITHYAAATESLWWPCWARRKAFPVGFVVGILRRNNAYRRDIIILYSSSLLFIHVRHKGSSGTYSRIPFRGFRQKAVYKISAS